MQCPVLDPPVRASSTAEYALSEVFDTAVDQISYTRSGLRNTRSQGTMEQNTSPTTPYVDRPALAKIDLQSYRPFVRWAALLSVFNFPFSRKATRVNLRCAESE